VARGVREWVRGAPGTHVWLAVLGVTSAVMALASPGLREVLLHRNSTNLVELREHPVRVLVVSALWIETPAVLLFYVLLFELIHAPAERWLGTRRWLTTVGVAHVGATLVSQQAVLWGIRADRLPRSMAHTVDIGVSYGIAGVVGVLAYAVPGRWRWGYVAAVAGFYGWSAARGRTFTDLGHLTALALGLACYWPSRRVPGGDGPPPGAPPSGGAVAGQHEGRGDVDRPGEPEGGGVGVPGGGAHADRVSGLGRGERDREGEAGGG
jgi:hypothetical protein